MIDPEGLEAFRDGYFSCSGQKIENLIIMQSTGLTDREGREIFEGDILRHSIPTHTTSHGAHRFYPHIIEWKLLESIEPSENMVGFELPEDWQQMEIIGNKWENPELLK